MGREFVNIESECTLRHLGDAEAQETGLQGKRSMNFNWTAWLCTRLKEEHPSSVVHDRLENMKEDRLACITTIQRWLVSPVDKHFV